jgi:hypothetical protein
MYEHVINYYRGSACRVMSDQTDTITPFHVGTKQQ